MNSRMTKKNKWIRIKDPLTTRDTGDLYRVRGMNKIQYHLQMHQDVVFPAKLTILTDWSRILLAVGPEAHDEYGEEWAVLAREPVKALGAFHAHEKTLQSCLPLPFPFEKLHKLTHSTETTKFEKHIHKKPRNLLRGPKKKNKQKKIK